MTKIRCEHCGQRQSDGNDACQFCGAPLPDQKYRYDQNWYSHHGTFSTFCDTMGIVASTSAYYPNEVYLDYEEEVQRPITMEEAVYLQEEEEGFFQRLWNRISGKDNHES